MKTNKPLTKNEKRELGLIDNPQVEFTSPAWGLIPLWLLGKTGISNRRKRVVKLRLRLRGSMEKEEYRKAKREEEIRFNIRFKVEQNRKIISNKPF